MIYAVFFFFILTFAQGESIFVPDSDLDGVCDCIDLCPNTPFDETVDVRGCSLKESFKPTFTLEVGIRQNSDSRYQTQTLVDFFALYQRNGWDVSLSTINGLYTPDSPDSDEAYFLTGGYTFFLEKSRWRISLGKAYYPNKSQENHGFIGFEGTYYLNTYDLFAGYGYHFYLDKSQSFRNYRTFSIGSGTYITGDTYLALSYQYKETHIPKDSSYRNFQSYLRYPLSSFSYATFTYEYALDNISYTTGLTFGIGVTF